MANNWNIPEGMEKAVRKRDQLCVYCGVKMRPYPETGVGARDSMTWEHIDNDENNISLNNIALCCNGCNSSKSNMKLSEWLKCKYCQRKGISFETVADVIKRALG